MSRKSIIVGTEVKEGLSSFFVVLGSVDLVRVRPVFV